jgi:hypothetical protein
MCVAPCIFVYDYNYLHQQMHNYNSAFVGVDNYNYLQQMDFQYIYCVSTSTPTCFGPIGPSSESYT